MPCRISPLALASRMAAAFTCVTALAAPAAAQDAQALRTAALAATCANCHGTAGKAAEGATVPGLAGRSVEHIVERMKSYKDGSRQATVMHQIAKGYSDAQIQQLAGYFAAQTR